MVYNNIHTKGFYAVVCAVVFVALTIMPHVAKAQTMEVSAWIPYWRSVEGVQSISSRMSSFTEVNPFLYTVKNNGELNQADSLTDQEWQQLKQLAATHNVRFIPTVMWSGSDAIHETLSDPVRRAEHIRSITREVYAHDLDGIDIDYEAKYAKTNPYFSLFLKELAEAIGYDRWVMCTIEARTPLDSRYSSPENIPADIEYANDFSEINKYCDRVRIMAYDQGRFDVKLNAEKAHPYIPVADADWVRKVIELTKQEIDPNKLLIGVPTYGYEYDMFVNANGRTEYSRLWSFNPGYATEVAGKLGLTPMRNSAGELFLTYPASQSTEPIIPLPNATRVMSWSDAEAIKQKFDLARELGVAGVSIFKIDGGEDQLVWNTIPSYGMGGSLATLNPPSTVPSDFDPTTPSNPGGGVAFSMPTQDLYYGLRIEDVRTLQKFLNSQGFTVAQSGGGSPGNETIFFGPATRAALVRFQKAHNITPAVGYYGPITRSTIASIQPSGGLSRGN